MSKLLSLLLILLSAAGCAIAPLNSTTTARTLGEGQNEARINVIIPGAMVERGITNDLDLGAGIEFQSTTVLNLFGKYGFINDPKGGFSLAGLGGVGIGSGTKSVYAGPVLSYRHDWFEAFTVIRYNYVHWTNNISEDDKADLLSFFPHKVNFSYSQVDVGVSYINEKAIMSLGMKVFALEKSNSSATPFFDIGFKF
ncbi:MAG: hypothetical protein H7177_12355 [Rhizobacter sp.]|nr:hypothetical protein [Bacteriovorax sp.]